MTVQQFTDGWGERRVRRVASAVETSIAPLYSLFVREKRGAGEVSNTVGMHLSRLFVLASGQKHLKHCQWLFSPKHQSTNVPTAALLARFMCTGSSFLTFATLAAKAA